MRVLHFYFILIKIIDGIWQASLQPNVRPQSYISGKRIRPSSITLAGADLFKIKNRSSICFIRISHIITFQCNWKVYIDIVNHGLRLMHRLNQYNNLFCKSVFPQSYNVRFEVTNGALRASIYLE